jgi:murein peptide amidase A
MRSRLARLFAGLFIFGAANTAQAQVPLASIERACERIAERLREVELRDCLDARLKAGDGSSHAGMPMLYRDFLPGQSRRTPFRVMLIGGIHGDELSAVSITFQWMKKLEAERLQPFHWRVIPSANPDGLLLPIASRTNGRGVDLNRNFATPDWDEKALDRWRKRTRYDPRRFPGSHAASEQETQWLTRQIRDFRPDAIISIHAPWGVLDYDGPLHPPQRFGYLRLQPLGIYPGSLGNYAGLVLRLPTITLELPHSTDLPTNAQSQRIWADMLDWLERNLPDAEPPLFQRLGDSHWMLNQPGRDAILPALEE